MQCPVCHVPLQMAERSGIEIDYCSQCRGVWLDRGELDKIIERAGTELNAPRAVWNDQPAPPPAAPQPPAYQSPASYAPPRRDDDDRRHYGHDHHKRKKRKNMFEELFDFD